MSKKKRFLLYSDIFPNSGIVGAASKKANHNIIESLIGSGYPKEGQEHQVQDKILPNVEKACQQLLEALLIDTDKDHNTKETAHRMAKMFVYETFRGRYIPCPKVTDFPNVLNLDQIYTVGPVTVRSACSHHFVPIEGFAWFGVKPNKDGRIIGLSKFARLCDWIMRRPQIQEEATIQLANLIENLIHPEGLALVVKARHLCMTWRGVEEHSTMMVTSEMRGVFRDDAKARQEFFNLIQGQEF